MHQYQPTILETGFLLERLLIQIAFLRDELKRSWIEFKKSPVTFSKTAKHRIAHRLRTLLSTPNVIPATLAAVAAITCAILVVVLFDKTASRHGELTANAGGEEVVIMDVSKPLNSANKPSTGKDGPGRVGFQNKKGEGSGPSQKLAQGGGGGGNGNPIPPQAGKLPPPSSILAAIPTAPPVHPPTLQLQASISIRRYGRISKLRFTAIRDRSLKSNPKVQAREKESEQIAAQVSEKGMDQVSSLERRGIWVVARGSLAVVGPAADLITKAERLQDLKSNNAPACCSNQNRRIRKTRERIRSQAQ